MGAPGSDLEEHVVLPPPASARKRIQEPIFGSSPVDVAEHGEIGKLTIDRRSTAGRLRPDTTEPPRNDI